LGMATVTQGGAFTQRPKGLGNEKSAKKPAAKTGRTVGGEKCQVPGRNGKSTSKGKTANTKKVERGGGGPSCWYERIGYRQGVGVGHKGKKKTAREGRGGVSTRPTRNPRFENGGKPVKMTGEMRGHKNVTKGGTPKGDPGKLTRNMLRDQKKEGGEKRRVCWREVASPKGGVGGRDKRKIKFRSTVTVTDPNVTKGGGKKGAGGRTTKPSGDREKKRGGFNLTRGVQKGLGKTTTAKKISPYKQKHVGD